MCDKKMLQVQVVVYVLRNVTSTSSCVCAEKLLQVQVVVCVLRKCYKC